MRCLGWDEAPYVRELEGNCLCKPTFWTRAGAHRLQVYYAPLREHGCHMGCGGLNSEAICQAEKELWQGLC